VGQQCNGSADPVLVASTGPALTVQHWADSHSGAGAGAGCQQ